MEPHTHTHTRTHARTHARTHTHTHTHGVEERKCAVERASVEQSMQRTPGGTKLKMAECLLSDGKVNTPGSPYFSKLHVLRSSWRGYCRQKAEPMPTLKEQPLSGLDLPPQFGPHKKTKIKTIFGMKFYFNHDFVILLVQTMLVDVCQCCCLLLFVCLPLSRHFPCCKTW